MWPADADDGGVHQPEPGGRHLLEKLRELEPLDNVGHVRARGLIGAVEIVADKATKALHPAEANLSTRLVEGMLDRGLCTRAVMDCICIAPPLMISEGEIDRLVQIIGETIPAVVAAARA